MSRSLILIEHDGQQARRASLSALALARKLEEAVTLLVMGNGVGPVAESVRAFGAERVLVADDPALGEPLADRYAAVLRDAIDHCGASRLLATSSTFAKDILPRAAALWDAPMLTDVTGVSRNGDGLVFERPVSAGSQIAAVRCLHPRLVLTARATAWHPPEPGDQDSPIEAFPVHAAALPNGMAFVSREAPASGRPDLGEARILVCGGRPLGDRATFERLIGGLADALGGAVGATRAAVDAGMAPNDFQVGQTGKIVAPEVYIGVGVSGAIQHMAGIQDSRIIVAINRDREAPIFQSATYGLVGDLHAVVPALLTALKSSPADGAH